MNYKQKYNRLLIFDGSHALHRALSVDNNWNMITSNGIKTGGIFGVLRTILKEVITYNYYPVVVFDHGLSTRRLELYPNYKHTVEKKEKQLLLESKEIKTEEELLDEEFKYEYNNQREILKQLLPLFNIPVLSFDNWEGDDIIYLLTKLSKDSIVVSDDKDLLQLIREDESGKCRVRRAMRDEFWDYSKIKENYDDVVYYVINKAIIGDQSDNIPSACYGVGEKTAKDLYTFYKYLKENNIKYPETEEELADTCKKYNLPKRKAFLNFSEAQFLTNIMLTDLSLVDEDVSKYDTKMLYNIEKNIDFFFENELDENLQKNNIISILNYLEIKTFDYNNLFKLISDTKDVIYNIDTKLSEKRITFHGSLF